MSKWKQANVVPVLRKSDISSYQKIIVQFLYFLSLVKFLKDYFTIRFLSLFIRNDLISQKQSSFKPGDSCINQLLAITYEIYKCFHACLNVRAVFRDNSKVFSNVWHQCLLYKLKQNGIWVTCWTL